MIDVVQEKVERGDALGQAAFEQFPFVGRDDARDQVEGEDALGALGVAVDVEGDALAQEGEVDGFAAILEIFFAHRADELREFAVMRPALAPAIDHFIEESGVLVFGPHSGGRFTFYTTWPNRTTKGEFEG